MKGVCLLFSANWAWFVHFYPKFVDNLIIYIIQMLAIVFLHFRFSNIANMFLYSPSLFRLFKTYLIFICSLIVKFSFNRYQKSIWAWKKFCRFLVFWVYLFKFSEFIDDALLYTLFFQISAIRKIVAGIFQNLI